MFKLKLDRILFEKRMNANQLSEMTGIRYPTILDMVKNKSKAWSPDNLDKVYKALELTSINELIEYVNEEATEA
ncbi:helix-turn-helix transcriptional regulator [Paenibacillus sp. FSL H8-0457]|uniref:helix-turn-helix domain-containing protein n=1 Tax=unclassified Paenibacillus TaxID=185978 RepID=UPI0003E2506B|nr:helix-turn-helix transcriptional regulator [Paenibacillus sp. FSL H8-457]ETT58166.1 Helix-turn-helix protein [Paenibacillus sp. FSL H8-457]